MSSARRAAPLYVTDLDGTLLASSGALSERAAERLTVLIERGVRITYATARSAEKAKSILGAVPFELPAIVLNGAMLIDAKTGRAMRAEALPDATTSRLLELCARAGVCPYVLGRENERDVLLWSAPRNEAQERYLARREGEPRMRRAEPLRAAATTMSLAVLDREPVLRELCSLVEAELAGACELKLAEEIYDAGWWLLEIFARGVDKARMLERLCAAVGVELADVTVFGDQPSDLGMMSIAGTAVAVSNAHPRVAASADVIVASNDEDAVAQYVWSRHEGDSRA